MEPSANQAARTCAITTSASMARSLTASGNPWRTKSSGSLYVPERRTSESAVSSPALWTIVRMRGFYRRDHERREHERHEEEDQDGREAHGRSDEGAFEVARVERVQLGAHVEEDGAGHTGRFDRSPHGRHVEGPAKSQHRIPLARAVAEEEPIEGILER